MTLPISGATSSTASQPGAINILASSLQQLISERITYEKSQILSAVELRTFVFDRCKNLFKSTEFFILYPQFETMARKQEQIDCDRISSVFSAQQQLIIFNAKRLLIVEEIKTLTSICNSLEEASSTSATSSTFTPAFPTEQFHQQILQHKSEILTQLGERTNLIDECEAIIISNQKLRVTHAPLFEAIKKKREEVDCKRITSLFAIYQQVIIFEAKRYLIEDEVRVLTELRDKLLTIPHPKESTGDSTDEDIRALQNREVSRRYRARRKEEMNALRAEVQVSRNEKKSGEAPTE